MGVTTFNQEFITRVAPARMFKALILDSHNLLPKIVPDGIYNIVFVEGDGGAGSIKQTNFPEGGHFKYSKHRIDFQDTEHFVCKYTLIESDAFFDRLEKVEYEVKFEASGNGGSVCKMTSTYYTKGDFELKEEDIRAGKDRAMGLYKVVKDYLVANPDVYALKATEPLSMDLFSLALVCLG